MPRAAPVFAEPVLTVDQKSLTGNPTMGAMKELMIEHMSARSGTLKLDVSFLCPICSHPAAAWVDMAADEDYLAEEVECLNREDSHSWTVELQDTATGVRGRISKHPGVDVSVTPLDTSDDWDDPLPEPGSYGIFLEALEEWRYNVTDLGEEDGGSSRNRMLFTTLYSIVEAYLSDTIIGAAIADTTVQRHMLKLEGLKGTVVSLETILDKPTIVRDLVKTALQAMSFHNLPVVNGIAKVAFGKPILPDDAGDRALVMKSIDKRHDCVHRNGKDKEDNQHTDITVDYLRKLGVIFEAMAEGLENAMQDAMIERWFEEVPVDPDSKKGA
jgi:hypothetical protein